MPPSRGICKRYFSLVLLFLQIFCMSIDFWFPSLLWPEQNSWYSAKWVLDDQLVQQTPKMRWSLLRIWVSGLIQANRARWAVIRQPPSSLLAAHLVQDCSRSPPYHPWIVHNTFPCPIPLHCWDRQHKVLSPKTNRAWWCGSGGGGDLDGGGGAWWWWCQQGVLSDLTSRSQTRPTSRCRPGEEISSNWNYSRTHARQSTCTRTNGHVAQSTRRTKANRLSKVVQ